MVNAQFSKCKAALSNVRARFDNARRDRHRQVTKLASEVASIARKDLERVEHAVATLVTTPECIDQISEALAELGGDRSDDKPSDL